PIASSPSFLFHDPATTALSSLSLHDALPICRSEPSRSSLDDVLRTLVRHHLEILNEACRQGVVLLEILVAAAPGIGGVKNLAGHALACLRHLKAKHRILVVLDFV